MCLAAKFSALACVHETEKINTHAGVNSM